MTDQLGRQKIVFAKQIAMQAAFWAACPLDEDHNYDRLMLARDVDEFHTFAWSGLVLHEYLKDENVDRIRQIVRSTAVRLLCNLCGVTPDVAKTAVQSERTTNSALPDGSQTVCSHERVDFWRSCHA